MWSTFPHYRIYRPGKGPEVNADTASIALGSFEKVTPHTHPPAARTADDSWLRSAAETALG